MLDDLTAVETEVHADNGAWYSVRILPYRTSENAIEGAVVSFIDISAQRNLQDEFRNALEYSKAILDTMREPMVVLNVDLKVQSVNEAFIRTFRVSKGKTEGKQIYELGNGQWDIPELRKLLGEILPKNTYFEDFLVEHDFPKIGKRSIMLNARRLHLEDQGTQKILLAMEDVTMRGGTTTKEWGT